MRTAGSKSIFTGLTGTISRLPRIASGSATPREGVSGRRGVILNVGWVMDYILDWRGSLTDRVLIAKLA
jgi:hypothetical protein